MIREIVLFSLVYSLAMTVLGYAVYVPVEFSHQGKPLQEYVEKSHGLYSGLMGVPLIDVGGLVFYSGNLVIDFLVNFVTAIPSVATALLSVFFYFFPIQREFAELLKLGTYTMLSVIIIVYLVVTLLQIRARGALGV